jgi:lipoate-protein ligase A
MKNVWRVLDTGLLGAAENMAYNRALLDARQAGESPDTLRFLRFTPSALVGYHQSVEQELNTAYCMAQGVEIQRRITGGGAIYFDETQIGWELYLNRDALGTADMEAISRRICEAAADGIRQLGVDARFRPRNDIEVDGRKISGTGGAFEGQALLFQGTLLVEFDVEKMLRVLRIPAEKLSDKAIASARERVANLRDLLGVAPALERVQGVIREAFGRAFGVEFAPGALLPAEQARYAQALREIRSEDWVHLVQKPLGERPLLRASHKFPGGLIHAAVDYDRVGERIKQIWLTGDFFIQPKRTIADLEAALRNVSIARLDETVTAFFAAHKVEMLMLEPTDFVAIIHQALADQSQAA